MRRLWNAGGRSGRATCGPVSGPEGQREKITPQATLLLHSRDRQFPSVPPRVAPGNSRSHHQLGQSHVRFRSVYGAAPCADVSMVESPSHYTFVSFQSGIYLPGLMIPSGSSACFKRTATRQKDEDSL